VPEFLVEFYVSRQDAGSAERAERARLGADALTREGRPVRYLRTIVVPEDETCYLLFEASSVDFVREATARAALPCERITRAFDGFSTRECSPCS
jgi:hypothetical protein